MIRLENIIFLMKPWQTTYCCLLQKIFKSKKRKPILAMLCSNLQCYTYIFGITIINRELKQKAFIPQVLTANIASTLDLYGVEKGLEHFSSKSTLNFQCFLDYLQQEVFSEISITKLRDVRQYEEKIEEVSENFRFI